MFRIFCLFTCCFFIAFVSYSQDVAECPPNMGFENGNLQNWKLYTGKILPNGDYGDFDEGEVAGRHTLIKKNTATDPWGTFPLNSPNGSEYIIRLGNKEQGSEADRISYSFDVPSDVEAYAIVFNYAVVFQEIDPPHPDWQQPKFTAVLIDENGVRDECASFEYRSKPDLPGFSYALNGAFFKPWSSVMVNLTKYIGKRVRLEFTTNDCAEFGHFGYAYIDLNENCATPVNGNVTCPESNSVTLRTLPGFASYRWFNRDTKVPYVGTQASLYLNPIPPIGTRIAVELVPYLYAGGCTDTLYTEIKNMEDIKIRSPLLNCLFIDLTSPSIVGGNLSGISYTYWKDPQATKPLPNPNNVRVSGTYYIMGRLLPSGCFSIMPVVVTLTPLPPVSVTPPAPVNYPGTIDLTKTFTPLPGVKYTYWGDKSTSRELTTPTDIKTGGIFYIKGVDGRGCIVVTAVRADIALPDIIIPNTFTPNGDGINDVLTVLLDSRIRVDYFRIYNRWGQPVYETYDINKFWNGYRGNTNPLPGVYFWVLAGEEKNRKYVRKGSVTVIR